MNCSKISCKNVDWIELAKDVPAVRFYVDSSDSNSRMLVSVSPSK